MHLKYGSDLNINLIYSCCDIGLNEDFAKKLK